MNSNQNSNISNFMGGVNVGGFDKQNSNLNNGGQANDSIESQRNSRTRGVSYPATQQSTMHTNQLTNSALNVKKLTQNPTTLLGQSPATLQPDLQNYHSGGINQKL